MKENQPSGRDKRKLAKLLWDRLRQGERSALDRLFRLYFDPLYYYGYRIVSDNDQVRDAIQNVFLQLWKSRNKLSDVRSVKGYLFASLRRQLLKQIDSQKRRQDLNDQYGLEAFQPMLNYEEWLEVLDIKREQKSALKNAIDSLTTRQKEAIYLKYYEGLSNQELAWVMKLKQQSIYNLVSEAIDRLRSFVENQ